MNNFQTILIAIFLAFFVFGVLIFSGMIKIGGSKKGVDAISGKVVVWGTIPSSQISGVLSNINVPSDSFNLSYVQKNDNDYQNDIINALAQDNGPDLLILKPDMVLKNSNFIYKTPYTSYSENLFRSNYIDGADILLSNDGILGYPLLVDPIVLYYNKNMLSNENVLYPPSTWDELFSLNDKLTKKNNDGTILESMIALGQYDNVNHAKDILSLLLLQSNNPIMERTDTGYRLAIKDSSKGGDNPFEKIIDFFLEFSNPNNTTYSWNRSLPNSFDMFISDKLAFYIGYASELFKIQSANPNLSYNFTMIPQTKGVNIKRTYGDMYVLVINKKSKNLASAFGVASLMSAPDFLKELAVSNSLPTGTRSLLNEKPKEPYLQSFFESAAVAHSWLDPDKEKTDSVFKELINNSFSNKLSTLESIDKAFNQIDLIVRSYDSTKQ